MNDAKRDERHDLEELRRLLVGPEKERLDQLSDGVEVPENFSDKVGEILPRAMQKSALQGEELAQAMMPTVEQIVRLSIKKDINRFADALFPVIGPAIRKSIRETIRQMMQSMNRTLEQSFSWQGIKWRLESMRTGIPVAQIAMLQSLIYRVDQIFLIHRETGLLLCHLGQDNIQGQDPDLVSSMLSAINDFVGDSFDVDQDRSLDSVEVGDFSIWVERGPDAIIAAAIRGEAPNSLRTTLQQTLEKIQHELGDTLRGFNGDTGPYESRADLLSDCLQARYQESPKKSSPVPVIMGVVLLLLLLYWLGLELQQEWQRDEYVASLENEPGYVITGLASRDGRLVISGLRDPLARDAAELLEESKLSPDAVVHRLAAYQSLQAPFLERRVRTMLDPPEGVELELVGTTLVLSGSAGAEWRQRLNDRIPLVVGIDRVDQSALRTRFSPALLNPPESVELSLENGVLYATGEAPQEWIRSLAAAAAEFDEVTEVDTRALQNLTELELVNAIDALENRAVMFDSGAALDYVPANVPQIVEMAREIIGLSGKLARKVQIVVKGYTDSVGNHADNVVLSRQRAAAIAELLVDAGIDDSILTIKGLEAPVAAEIDAIEQRYNRRVEFDVIIE